MRTSLLLCVRPKNQKRAPENRANAIRFSLKLMKHNDVMPYPISRWFLWRHHGEVRTMTQGKEGQRDSGAEARTTRRDATDWDAGPLTRGSLSFR